MFWGGMICVLRGREASRAKSLCSHHLLNQTLLAHQMAKSKTVSVWEGRGQSLDNSLSLDSLPKFPNSENTCDQD